MKLTLSFALPTIVLATRVTAPTNTTSLLVPTTSLAMLDAPDILTPPPPEILVSEDVPMVKAPPLFISTTPVPVVTTVPTLPAEPKSITFSVVKSTSPLTPVIEAALD